MISSRIDMIISTTDLYNKSVELYQKIIGFEMRALSNPVAIFKYEFISFYAYQDTFFTEQFGFTSSELSGNGMLSVGIDSEEELEKLRNRLAPQESKLFNFIEGTDYFNTYYKDNSIIIKDFNGLTFNFWVNSTIR